MKPALYQLDPLSRRRFAETVAKAALGVSLLPRLGASADTTPGADNRSLPGFGKAKHVIWLQMLGGMSHIDTLDPKTGERLWDMGFWGSWVESSAVGGDDGLGYIGSSDLRRITSFDPKTGRIIWRTDVYGAPWGKPLVTDRFVYDGVSAIVPYMTRHVGGVVALDRVSGKLAWRYPLPNPSGTLHYGFAGSPTRSGDTFVIGGLDGALYAFPIS